MTDHRNAENKDEYLEKSEAFVQRLGDNQDFLDWVRKIRKKHSIMPSAPDDYFDLEDCLIKNCQIHNYCKSINNKKLTKEVEEYLEKKFELRSFWVSVFIDYIMTDEWILNDLVSEIDSVDLLSQILDEASKKSFDFDGKWQEYGELLVKPIAIRLSPYTTQKDLIKYITNYYHQDIKPLQKFWKNKETSFGKSRRKSSFIVQRNNFIYDNRDKTPKELVSMVNEEFGRLYDYAYITKIRSEEIKKRK